MADTAVAAMTAAGTLGSSDLFYVVQSAVDRKAGPDLIAQYSAASIFCYLNSTYTLTSTTSSQKLFNTTTNGAVTLPQTGLYLFRAQLYLSSMATSASNNGAFSVIGAGTATISGQIMASVGIDATTTSTAAAQGGAFVQAASAFTTNTITGATGSAMGVTIHGIFKCTATGTLIPSIALTTAAAAVVGVGSHIVFENIADNAVYTRGTWS